MSYQKANTPYTWVNEEDSKTTPINAEKFNEKEATLNTMDDRIVELEAMKASKATVNSMVQDVQMNMATGVLTVTYVNGSIQTYDTAIEKIAVNFAYDAKTEKITITLENGNVQEIDLSAFITNYSFEDSDTVAFNSDGNNVTAIVKEGSIEEKHLRPDYLAEIKVQSANAQTSANSASNSAKSASNDATTASDKAGEALASAIRAENAADKAEAVTNIHYATKDRAGIVAPQDIHVDEQGNMVMIAETTDSTLRNSYAGGISILAHGKYEQDGTTGAQLVDIADFELVKPDTRTRSFDIGLLSAGTYHINVELSGTTTKVSVKTQYVDENGAVTKDTDYIALTNGDNILTSSYDFNRLYFFIDNTQADGATASFNNVMFSVEAAEYEPYTGRKAAPNTDYPMPIKGVKGKNLLENTATDTEVIGLTYTVQSDKSVRVVGTTTAADHQVFVGEARLSAGSYILSGAPDNINRLRIAKDNSSNLLGHDMGSGFSFTLDEPATVFVSMRAQSTIGTEIDATFYPMIRPASVKDPTYAPYGCLQFKTRNANLIDFRDGASGAGNGGVAHTNRGDGSYTRVGTATNQWGNQWFKGRYNVIPDDTNVLIHLLPGESYFVGGCALYSADENGAIAVFDLVYDAAFTVNPSKYPNGVKITGIRCQQMVTGTTYNDVVYPRIFHGTEDLGLMVYEESVATLSNPIELGGIGDVADVMDAEKIEHRWHSFVVDSSMVNTSTANGTVYINLPLTAKSDTSALCTHYNNVKSSGSGNTLYFKDEANGTTAETYKAFLDSNEVEFAYQLAEPTTEALPTADQIALHGLKSFDGVTYVETDSEVKPTIHSKYGTSKVGAMALELQNENANLKIQLSNTKGVEVTETKVSFPAKMTSESATGIWNAELERPTEDDYILLGWTIINPRANVTNVYIATVNGYIVNGDIVESGAHAAFSVTIRAMWKAL